MGSLDNIKLGYSILGEKIYLYRHGKNPNVALEKRDAEFDVMKVIVEHMMDKSPNGSVKQFTLDGETYYELTLKKVAEKLS